MNLAAYRTAMRAVLGTAVDASSWSDALLEEGLRSTLADVTAFWVYEDVVTVATAGYEQVVAPAGAAAVLAVLYPWYEGASWSVRGEPWRFVGENRVRFERVAPEVGEEIAVRYTLRQTIADLDGAQTTTVPAWAERAVVFMACSHAAASRRRQLSENPAQPKEAVKTLAELAERWRRMAAEWLTPPQAQVSWNGLGLD